jgi:hypothetical protein
METGVFEIEHKRCWHNLKYILFICLTIVSKIAQHILLIRQLSVKLEMVKRLLKYLILNTVLVLIAFFSLLPTHINEGIFCVLIFNPARTMRHHPTYNI